MNNELKVEKLLFLFTLLTGLSVSALEG